MFGTVSATISHQFEVSEFANTDENGALFSPDLEVMHNDVTLKFNLKLIPNDPSEQNKDHIGLYLFYKDGPQAKIKLEYAPLVINGRKRSSLRDVNEKDYDIGRGWGFEHVLPRSVKALKDSGYLSSRGKILHIRAELSIQGSAFVRPTEIFASLTHKFDVQQMFHADQGKRIGGAVVSVVHNNVKLDFKLVAVPNQTDRTGNSCIGLYVEYLKGPNNDLVMDLELVVVKGRKRHSLLLSRAHQFTLNTVTAGYGSTALPRSPEALGTAGYLTWDNKLHVIAELSIPESAFSVPEPNPSVVQVDSVGFRLYQEITTPADTTSPASNRVELVSNDDRHFWAHKDVLSCASDVFEDLFDPSRPEEAKMDCFKQGVLTFDDLSGEALKQMLHFIYLRQTGKKFENFALEILPVADIFLVKGLKEVCGRQLIEGMDLMSLESLCHCLAASYTFNLPALTTACTETLPIIIQHNDDHIDQEHLVSLINLCQKHSLVPLRSAFEEKLAQILDNTNDRAQFLFLLSLARKNQLEVLVNHCVRWFRNKYDVLKADGFISELMNGKIENGQDVLGFLLDSVVTLPSH